MPQGAFSGVNCQLSQWDVWQEGPLCKTKGALSGSYRTPPLIFQRKIRICKNIAHLLKAESLCGRMVVRPLNIYAKQEKNDE